MPRESPAIFHLNSLCEPLRLLVQGQALSLDALLTRLPLLAVRFDNVYKDGPIGRSAQFATQTDTFDALLPDVSPLECAKEMTNSDAEAFTFMSPRAFKNSGRELLYLLRMQNIFQNEIAECCRVYPDLNYRLNEIAYVGILYE